MMIELGTGTHYQDVQHVNTSKKWSVDRNSNARHLETTLLQKPIKGSDDAKQKHSLGKVCDMNMGVNFDTFSVFFWDKRMPMCLIVGALAPPPVLHDIITTCITFYNNRY
jgi:hypothetical protein